MLRKQTDTRFAEPSDRLARITPSLHHSIPDPGPARRSLPWLAAEPYRLFFLSGAVWSIVGVALWPLFYSGFLGFSPNLVHARLMIEAFGGAFVAGFLGTAGPRMAAAPKLTPAEFLGLFCLHQAGAIAHLAQHQVWGDACFVALLLCLLAALSVRLLRFRNEAPPPQLFLALIGLICGIAGAGSLMLPATYGDPRTFRLANLLLDQGFLVAPILGVGSFVFPRMLGGEFGEARTAVEQSTKLILALAAGLLVTASFFVEAYGLVLLGYALRLFAAGGYLLGEIRWHDFSGRAASGTLGAGIYWALGSGGLGLALAGFFYAQHVSVEHFLYIGGFGLLMLLVSSRVIFGHSGDLAGSQAKSGSVRFLIFLAILAATTRASPAWAPRTTVSHHIYAAVTWGIVAAFWIAWHRGRFFKRDEKP